MTVGAVDTLTEHEARRLTDRIRIALDRVSTAWADLAERITEAYQRRADLALGYGSWAEYAAAELKQSEGLAAEVRLQLVGMLTAAGMSPKAIAPTIGVDRSTVSRDRSAIAATQGVQPAHPDAERIDRTTGEVLAEAEREGLIVKLTGPESVSDPTPAKVVGLDGKTYARPEPKTAEPRRAPLRDGFRDAALDLDKLVHRFERLAGDDRLSRNKNEVARYANDLTRAAEALQRLADQLSNS